MNRKEKALRIATLHDDFNGEGNAYTALAYDMITDEFIEQYSSFNGLMEIVETINSDDSDLISIEILFDRVYIHIDRYKQHEIYYSTGLLDALQDAIIYVLEYKEQI